MEFSIVTIAAFVGILNEATKAIARSFGKNVNRYIPICSVIYGIILGVCGYFMSDVKMGNNLIEAIIIGVSAGLSSTGVHQAFHQLAKPAEEADPQVDEEVLEEILNEDGYDDDEEYDDDDPEPSYDEEDATADEDEPNLEIIPIPEDDE